MLMKELETQKKVLVGLLREGRRPICDGEISSKSYGLYFEEANLDGRPYSMPFLILPTKPCSWLLRSGGCFECGYSNLSNRAIKDEELQRILSKGMDLLKNIPHEMVAIGTSGSFLDEEEVSKSMQDKILRDISALPNITYVGIESRPEYVIQERLKEISELVWPKMIMLGMGLETSNDLIRRFCINKGLNTKIFLRALGVIKLYKNISALAYVLLGKPFLNKEADVLDAVNSISFAVESGFDRVVLMSISLRENTLTRLLYDIGEYTPPTPRRTVEVLKHLRPEVRNRLILANPRLPEIVSVGQCKECHELLSQLLILYKYTSDYNYIKLADGVDFNCQCAANWKNFSEESEISIEHMIVDRYERTLEKLERGKFHE